MSDDWDDVLETGSLSEAQLETLTEGLRDSLQYGVRGPDSAIGMSLRELELDAAGLVVTVRLGDETLLEYSFEPEAWERLDADDPGFEPTHLVEELAIEIDDSVDLHRRLIERRRDRLAECLVDETEAAIRSRLEAVRDDIDWDVMTDVVELSYECHHGDPPWVSEQGYPPYGLEVTSWDPDAEIIVEIDEEPPEPASLIDEAVDRLLEAVTDG